MDGFFTRRLFLPTKLSFASSFCFVASPPLKIFPFSGTTFGLCEQKRDFDCFIHRSRISKRGRKISTHHPKKRALSLFSSLLSRNTKKKKKALHHRYTHEHTTRAMLTTTTMSTTGSSSSFVSIETKRMINYTKQNATTMRKKDTGRGRGEIGVAVAAQHRRRARERVEEMNMNNNHNVNRRRGLPIHHHRHHLGGVKE